MCWAITPVSPSTRRDSSAQPYLQPFSGERHRQGDRQLPTSTTPSWTQQRGARRIHTKSIPHLSQPPAGEAWHHTSVQHGRLQANDPTTDTPPADGIFCSWHFRLAALGIALRPCKVYKSWRMWQHLDLLAALYGHRTKCIDRWMPFRLRNSSGEGVPCS